MLLGLCVWARGWSSEQGCGAAGQRWGLLPHLHQGKAEDFNRASVGSDLENVTSVEQIRRGLGCSLEVGSLLECLRMWSGP